MIDEGGRECPTRAQVKYAVCDNTMTFLSEREAGGPVTSCTLSTCTLMLTVRKSFIFCMLY